MRRLKPCQHMNGVYFYQPRACARRAALAGKAQTDPPCVQTQTAVTWCLLALILAKVCFWGLVLFAKIFAKSALPVILHI